MAPKLEDKVVKANIAYHSALAKLNYHEQPHFSPENIQRMDSRIADLASKTTGSQLLDIGCGTGFILDIAKKHFHKVVGVDITEEMINKVDLTSGNVEVHLGNTEDMSFLPSNSFDVCTAYSFLHHLVSFEPTIREAYRCLHPGGLFFSDQDPSHAYYQFVHGFNEHKDLPEILKSEVQSADHSFEDAITGTDLTIEDVSLAEYHGFAKGGIDPDEMMSILQSVGFKNIQIRYEWYLGQGKVIHQRSQEASDVIEEYLRSILPASRPFFKYISFLAEK